MRTMASVLLATAFSSFLAVNVAAAETPPIVVAAPDQSIEQWSRKVGQDLDRLVAYPLPMVGELHEGVVAVQFLCSDDGTPASVTIKRSSGFRDLDNAALRSVRQIKSLHPLPDGIAHGQAFQANILFATSQRSFDRQMTGLRAEARQNNARFAGQPREVALNIGVVTAGAH